jgi:hypothetical protein
MDDYRIPHHGGFVIAKRHGVGWTIDVELDGQVIKSVYTNGNASDRTQVIQEATYAINSAIESVRTEDKP